LDIFVQFFFHGILTYLMRFLRVFLFLVFVGVSTAQAQICPCGDGTNSADCCPPGDPVPISGIEWLIGGGTILGVRQFFVSRKNRK
jgi:hypothetical protein